MCDINLEAKDFNPRILYTFKKHVTGDQIMDAHSHDFTSLIYILEGTCTYRVNDVEHVVQEGSLIILNPEIKHQRIMEPNSHVVEFHVGFNNFYICGLPEGHLIKQENSYVLEFSAYKKTFMNCCDDILNEQNKNEPYKSLILKALVMKLITLILRENALSETHDTQHPITIEKSDRSEIVQAIVDYMNENYTKNISLSKLSQNMYLSSVYISKIFKEELGESPINYLIQLRLSKASELLEQHKDLSIKEIAQSVGYGDAYYFSKLFKKYYNTSPSRYVSNDGA